MSSTSLLAFTDYETDGLEMLTLEPLEFTTKLCSVNEDGFIESENILATYSTLILPSDPDWADKCKPVVLDMHLENGLIEAFATAKANEEFVPTTDQASAAAHDIILEVVNRLKAESEDEDHKVTIHMAGIGVAAFDRPMARFRMPKFDELLHHRPVDVSVMSQSLKFMKKGYEDGNPLWDTVAHRSEADVDQGIAAFNYYSKSIPHSA